MSNHGSESDSSWEDFNDVGEEDPENRSSSDGGAASANRDLLQRSVSVNELKCGCCFELMVDPTTLDCGHSFCRTCLAMWWKESGKKQTCPECRQIWISPPLVNYALRSIIERLHAQQLVERKAEIQENQEKSEALAQFNQFGEQHRQRLRGRVARQPQDHAHLMAGGDHQPPPPGNVLVQQVLAQLVGGNNQALRRLGSRLLTLLKGCCGACLVLLIFFVVYRFFTVVGYVWNKQSMLALKPVGRWSATDVSLWLDQVVGEWTRPYQHSFHDNNIDGQLLMTMDDHQLEEKLFFIMEPSHRKTMLGYLGILRTSGMRRPRDLWEFRSQFEGLTMFFLWTLVDSPRLGIFLIYFFYYDELFLHFIHATCTAPSAVEQLADADTFQQQVLYPAMDLTPSWDQEASFVAKFLFLPYLLFIQFVWQWIGEHYIIGSLAILGSVCGTISEAYVVVQTWQKGVGALKRYVVSYCQLWGGLCLCVVVWPLLPAMLCRLSFYWMLLSSMLLMPLREYFIQRGGERQRQHNQQAHPHHHPHLHLEPPALERPPIQQVHLEPPALD